MDRNIREKKVRGKVGKRSETNRLFECIFTEKRTAKMIEPGIERYERGDR